MGIILILIGIIIQRKLFKSKTQNTSEESSENSSLFMKNPIVRIILAILSWIIIIGGMIRLFS
jgi:C4-dicarboxylate transporter